MKHTSQEIIKDIKLIASISYIRGSGKGGQKINSTSSRAEIRFDIFELNLTDEIQSKLIGIFGQNNVTIQDQSGRNRESNMESAWNKVLYKLDKALHCDKIRVTEMKKSTKKRVKSKLKIYKKQLSQKKSSRNFNYNETS